MFSEQAKIQTILQIFTDVFEEEGRAMHGGRFCRDALRHPRVYRAAGRSKALVVQYFTFGTLAIGNA